MGSTWESLLDEINEVRTSGMYRDDVERRDHLIETMVFTIQTMLEKLRDADAASQARSTTENMGE